jgi:hypothetical protein
MDLSTVVMQTHGCMVPAPVASYGHFIAEGEPLLLKRLPDGRMVAHPPEIGAQRRGQFEAGCLPAHISMT